MTNPTHITLTAPLNLKAESGAANLPMQFSGQAYSGGQVEHWGSLVIDLATTRFAATMPLLAEHDRREIIGVIDATTNDGKTLAVAGKLFSDIAGSCGEKIAQCAMRGAPYQMSIGMFAYNELWVAAGSSLTVNGQLFHGPLMVLQNGQVREVSIVALGADPDTDAQFFSAPNHTNPPKKQGNTMDLQAALAKIAKLEAELAAAPGIEQARIQGIEAQAIPGHEALILSLKFDGKSTAGDAAMAVLAAEKQSRSAMALALAAEAPKPLPLAVPPVVNLTADTDKPTGAKLDIAAKLLMSSNPGMTYIAAIKSIQGV